jgi:hypothetical protein
MQYSPAPNIETTLPGLTLTELVSSGHTVALTTADGRTFSLYHDQDCCESVNVFDIKGDLASVIGSPLTSVKEEISRDWPADVPEPSYSDSHTWTTFTFTTEAGATVAIRWLGTSNGYYSESVSFAETRQ